jgi:hypothetical protein
MAKLANGGRQKKAVALFTRWVDPETSHFLTEDFKIFYYNILRFFITIL